MSKRSITTIMCISAGIMVLSAIGCFFCTDKFWSSVFTVYLSSSIAFLVLLGLYAHASQKALVEGLEDISVDDIQSMPFETKDDFDALVSRRNEVFSNMMRLYENGRVDFANKGLYNYMEHKYAYCILNIDDKIFKYIKANAMIVDISELKTVES